MVRATRMLEVIDEEHLVENARQLGERLLAGLVDVQRELGGLVSNARGRGLMIAFDLPDPASRDRAHAAIVDGGLLVLKCGSRSVRFRPPLNLTAAEADAGLDIVRASLKRL
jgi:L-lysine 6-transaminase